MGVNGRKLTCDTMPKLTKQQKKVSENVKHRNRSVLVAPTDFGKTRVYINGVSGYKKIIIVTNTYESVTGVARDFHLFRPNAIIVVPQGQSRIRRHYCNNNKCSDCDAIKKPKRNPKKKQLKGKTIDAEYAIKHYPNYCPYHFLIKLANEMADVVITHHSMLTENNRLKREGALVCDEVDEALRPTSILLSKYEIGKNEHLETSREKSDLEYIISIVRELLDKNPYSDPIDKQNFKDKFNYFLGRLKEIF